MAGTVPAAKGAVFMVGLDIENIPAQNGRAVRHLHRIKVF